jgi:hypothetical protein
MANLALDIQTNAPRNQMGSAATSIPSSFTIALDTVRRLIPPDMIRKSHHIDTIQVQLAETFLGIAESLRKPRGSLMR